jgi:hypothetical protein
LQTASKRGTFGKAREEGVKASTTKTKVRSADMMAGFWRFDQRFDQLDFLGGRKMFQLKESECRQWAFILDLKACQSIS